METMSRSNDSWISILVSGVVLSLVLSLGILVEGGEVIAQGLSPQEVSRSLTQEEKSVIEFAMQVQNRAYAARDIEHIQELPIHVFVYTNMLNLQGAYQISPEDINSLVAHSRNGVSLPKTYKGPKAPDKEKVDWLMDEFGRLEKGCFDEAYKN